MNLPMLAVRDAMPIDTEVSPDDQLEELWRRRAELLAELAALTHADRELHAKLPAWARPGPCYLRRDGTWDGPLVGWPMIEDDGTLEPGRPLNRRPSPDDIRTYFGCCVIGSDAEDRARARQVYRDQMRALVARLRRQRDAYAKCGITANKRSEELADAILKIEAAIGASSIAALPGASLRLVAAVMLIEIVRENDETACLDDPEQPFGKPAGKVLRLIRPHLTGLIRQDVDELLDNPATPIKEMSFNAA